MPVKALYVGAGAAYPDSPGLRNKYQGLSNFGDPIVLWKKAQDGTLWLPREGRSFKEDQRIVGCTVNSTSTFKSRNPEQARVVDESSALLLEGRSHIIEAPTGFGKTACALEIIHRVARQTLIIVTKEDVKTQWIAAFQKFWGLARSQIGVIQGDLFSVAGKPVSIAMIQSVHKDRRYPEWVYRSFGLIVVDECHRMGADKFGQAAWQFPAKLRLGLSATPYRRDGKGVVFKSHIGQVLVKTEAIPLIPKILVWYKTNRRVGSIPHKAGKTGHMTRVLAADVERNIKIAEFAGEAYKKGRTVVIFSDTLAHLDALYDFVVMARVKRKDIGRYVGGLTEYQRKVEKAKKVILATYAMCSEATDAPWWDTAVLATPKSEVKQIVGRILREYEGKKPPVVLDIVDTSSVIFSRYYSRRLKWYAEVGAEVKQVY